MRAERIEFPPYEKAKTTKDPEGSRKTTSGCRCFQTLWSSGLGIVRKTGLHWRWVGTDFDGPPLLASTEHRTHSSGRAFESDLRLFQNC